MIIWLTGAFVTYLALIIIFMLLAKKKTGFGILKSFRIKYPDQIEASDTFILTTMNVIGVLVSLAGWPLVWIMFLFEVFSKEEVK